MPSTNKSATIYWAEYRTFEEKAISILLLSVFLFAEIELVEWIA
jgi:hypothetical protein